MVAKVLALATHDEKGVMKKFQIERRAPGPGDVSIRVAFCGICHQIKNEWKGSFYPMVPGHEIVGHVDAVGSKVTKFKVGDKDYVLRVPDNLDLAAAAPLLCAGITVWSPLVHWGITARHTVGVLGLGGLGHMAVKIAVAMGCQVVVLSSSPSKEKLAQELGAQQFLVTSDAAQVAANANTLDFIIDTVSAPHSLDLYFGLMKHNASICIVGIPPENFSVAPGAVVFKRLKVGGSLIGGITETQEMLDFCGRHNITSMIELIPSNYLNKALARLEKNDVKFRFVIDVSTIAEDSPEVETA